MDVLKSLIVITIFIPIIIQISYRYISDFSVLYGIKTESEVSLRRFWFGLKYTFLYPLLGLVYYVGIYILIFIVNLELYNYKNIIYVLLKIALILVLVIFINKLKFTNYIYSTEKAKKHYKKNIDKNKNNGIFKGDCNRKYFYRINKFLIMFLIVFLLSIYIEYVISKI